MRIDAYSAVSNIYTNKSKIRTATVSQVASSDKVEISQFGRDFQIAKQAVKDAPDVREDKVKDIKSRLLAGTYNISSRELADKLVGNI